MPIASRDGEIDEIRKKMAEIRLDLHRDVRGVRAGTEAATDWRYYVRHYPWPCLAAAVALGYFVVPRRPARVNVVPAEPESSSGQQVEKKAKKAGLLAMAFGFLGPIAMRAAQNYAVNSLDSWIVQQGGLGTASPTAARPPDQPMRPGPP